MIFIIQEKLKEKLNQIKMKMFAKFMRLYLKNKALYLYKIMNFMMLSNLIFLNKLKFLYYLKIKNLFRNYKIVYNLKKL